MNQPLTNTEAFTCHPHYPSVLATTEELNALLHNNTVIVQADLDPHAFEFGHIPGARSWDWTKDLRDPKTQEVINEEQFADLMARTGISNDHKDGFRALGKCPER